MNQKQFLSNCSKQSLNTYICTHIYMYIHIHIYLQHSSFWFCLNLPPQSLVKSQSLPSFQFPMCKYNGICSGSWHGADVSCYCLCSSACLSGQVSRDTAGQFSQSHKTCECQWTPHVFFIKRRDCHECSLL